MQTFKFDVYYKGNTKKSAEYPAVDLAAAQAEAQKRMTLASGQIVKIEIFAPAVTISAQVSFTTTTAQAAA